ncbi:unnamed protein product [Lampetra planeri]
MRIIIHVIFLIIIIIILVSNGAVLLLLLPLAQRRSFIAADIARHRRPALCSELPRGSRTPPRLPWVMDDAAVPPGQLLSDTGASGQASG